MKTVVTTISIMDLSEMAEKMFERLVKAVVDIERGIMVVDAGLHADEELLLLDSGSEQKNLWGINLHLVKFGSEEFIGFDSMINLRPRDGNRSRSVDNPVTQEQIRRIVNKLVIS